VLQPCGNLRKKYPWRLGATSFVVPADLATNVRCLIDLVDDVQLLFFESAARARLPHRLDVAGLADLAREGGLTYTVHLPTDIRLGAATAAERQAGLDEIRRLVEELAPLDPAGYDLHLLPEPGLAEAAWLENLDRSLALLAVALGGDACARIGIENIDYPYAMVRPLVEKHGFAVCLDVGHLLRYGHDWQEALARDLPRANHVHYHGVRGGKDHGAVVKEQAPVTVRLGEYLAQSGFAGVVTLEMYALDKLNASLAELACRWGEYQKELQP